MATVKLRNITTGMSKIGALVKVSSTNKAAFEYITDISTLSVIGTIANSVSPGGMATVNLINEGSAPVTPVNPLEGHIIVSTSPPTSPKVNEIWIDSTQT
jgi:hypothetical protein